MIKQDLMEKRQFLSMIKKLKKKGTYLKYPAKKPKKIKKAQ